MAKRRAQKIWKLNYWKADPEYAAQITLFADPAEVRIASAEDKFLSVRDDGITLGPGIGNSVNIQGMSQNLKYAGMLTDLPFPLAMMPTTPASPFPKQIMVPPLLRQLPTIRDLVVAASTLAGI